MKSAGWKTSAVMVNDAFDTSVIAFHQLDLVQREGVADDVLGDVAERLAAARPQGAAVVHMKAAVFPAPEAVGAFLRQQAFAPQQGQQARGKQSFQRFEIRPRGRATETAIRFKEAIGHQRMQMRMEPEIVAKGVDGQDDGGHTFRRAQDGAQIIAQAVFRRRAEGLQEGPVVAEIGPQHDGDGEHVVPVRQAREYAPSHTVAKKQDTLLVATGAEPPAPAGEGQKIVLPALRTADAGEAAREIATGEEFFHDMRDHRTQKAQPGLVAFRIERKEFVKMRHQAPPERRGPRLAGAIGAIDGRHAAAPLPGA